MFYFSSFFLFGQARRTVHFSLNRVINRVNSVNRVIDGFALKKSQFDFYECRSARVLSYVNICLLSSMRRKSA